MRPRFVERGKAIEAVEFESLRNASMRPRFVERGKTSEDIAEIIAAVLQ